MLPIGSYFGHCQFLAWFTKGRKPFLELVVLLSNCSWTPFPVLANMSGVSL